MSGETFGYRREKRLPHAARIVYQGLEGAYSNLAAVQVFRDYEEASFSHVKSFDAAVRAVDEGTGDYAVIPIENSTAGSVADSYDALAKREVSVVGEYLLPVKHALLAAKGTALSDIKTVYSHPQGLKQCAQFFEAHPEIEAVAVSNTAVAAQLVQAMGKRDTAAVASAYAGQIYGLKVLIPALNYRAENTTRFLVIGKEKLYLEGAKTVSLMMETKHEAGALYHVLGALYGEGINLLRLAARPVPEISWAYRFFLDCAGSLEDAAVQRALREVERLSTNLRILGCF